MLAEIRFDNQKVIDKGWAMEDCISKLDSLMSTFGFMKTGPCIYWLNDSEESVLLFLEHLMCLKHEDWFLSIVSTWLGKEIPGKEDEVEDYLQSLIQRSPEMASTYQLSPSKLVLM